jgi:hypothetical protein
MVPPMSWLLAVSLLTLPVGSGGEELCQNCWRQVQQVALGWQVLDERELRYVMHGGVASWSWQEWRGDLKLLKERVRALEAAPRLEEVERLPRKEVIVAYLKLNRDVRQHWDSRKDLWSAWQWEMGEAVRECDELYRFWDTARDARCEFYYITVRRQALLDLERQLRTEWGGRWPPPVPLWRLGRVE